VAGQTFGPYRLDALLGRGGMGEVYRAFDTVKKRTVALKRLHPHLADDGEFKARFRREAEVAARLTEPHVIPIHDYGEIDGQLFIDMRLVDGVDLRGLLEREGPLSAIRAVGIVTQIASALAAAHAEGLIHRDVKPPNVLIARARHASDSDEDYAYLVDFGIAHSAAATSITATGATVGTLAYMAPERFLGRPVDHRVDIYALGCVLYESLTGQRAFPGEGAAELMYRHLNTPPPVPSQTRPDLPSSLDRVVAWAMAKNPEERYPSAADFASSARQAVTNPRRLTVSIASDPVTEPEPTLVVPPTRHAPTEDSPQLSARVDRGALRPDPAPTTDGTGNPHTSSAPSTGTRATAVEPLADPAAEDPRAQQREPVRRRTPAGNPAIRQPPLSRRARIWVGVVFGLSALGVVALPVAATRITSMPIGPVIGASSALGISTLASALILLIDLRRRNRAVVDLTSTEGRELSLPLPALPTGRVAAMRRSLRRSPAGWPIVAVALISIISSVALFFQALGYTDRTIIAAEKVGGVTAGQLNGSPVIIASEYRGIQLWDLATGRPRGATIPINSPVAGHANLTTTQLNGKSVIVTASPLQVWDMETGQPIGPILGNRDGETDVAIGNLGGRPVVVSTGGLEPTVRVWDLASGQLIGQPLTGHSKYLHSVAVSELDGKPVIVSCDLHDLRIWDLATGSLAKKFDMSDEGGAFSMAVAQRDGRPVVIIGGGDNTARVRDLATGQLIGQPITGHASQIVSIVTVQINGQTVVASGSIDGTVVLSDLNTGKSRGTFSTGHITEFPYDGLTALASVVVDGRAILISGGDDRAVRTWDLNARAST
jgi:serine/threonine protein kinase